MSTAKKVKHVVFNPLPHVHTMYVWLFASKQARKGEWEQHARDRSRFSRRIQHIENCISYVFLPTHRQKMFEVLQKFQI